MMNDVAHMVTADHSWTITAFILIVSYCLISAAMTFRYIIGGDFRHFRSQLRKRARLCLQQTGYAGAIIARHTVLVTLNVLVLNLSLNLHAMIKMMDDHSDADLLLQRGLNGLVGVCIAMIAIIGTITFALCNEVARISEDGQ